MELGSVLPDMLCFVCGVVVFLLDWAITGRLVKLLEGREKLVAACGAGLAVLACAALILALNWTGAWTFTGETPFSGLGGLGGGGPGGPYYGPFPAGCPDEPGPGALYRPAGGRGVHSGGGRPAGRLQL